MPLRNPRYFNRTDFYAHADYHDIEIPRQIEMSIRTNTNRSGRGGIGLRSLGIPLGIEGELSDSVELQSAYVLEPAEKASFSKVLDVMERGDHDALKILPLPTQGDHRWVVSRDELVELTGVMSLSPVSSIGKIMNVALQLVGHKDIALRDLSMLFDTENLPEPAEEIFKAVYLRNEIPEIPTLFKLELDEADAPWEIFVSCAPGHFVGEGAAATDCIEGDATVVGVVKRFVDNDPSDGFISTEPWTLHGWERTLKTLLRTQMDELTGSLIPTFDSAWKQGEAIYYIKGPAVIIDAIAIF